MRKDIIRIPPSSDRRRNFFHRHSPGTNEKIAVVSGGGDSTQPEMWSKLYILYIYVPPSAPVHNIIYMSPRPHILRLYYIREFCFLFIFVVVAIWVGPAGERWIRDKKFDKVLDVHEAPKTCRFHPAAKPRRRDSWGCMINRLRRRHLWYDDDCCSCATAGSHYQ